MDYVPTVHFLGAGEAGHRCVAQAGLEVLSSRNPLASAWELKQKKRKEKTNKSLLFSFLFNFTQGPNVMVPEWPPSQVVNEEEKREMKFESRES